MLTFSARYARKVQYCDIACRAFRKKNALFLTFAPPPIRNIWIDAPVLECSKYGTKGF